MKKVRYKNVTVYISGKVNKEELEKSTMKFIRNVDKRNKNTRGKDNGYNNSSRAV